MEAVLKKSFVSRAIFFGLILMLFVFTGFEVITAGICINNQHGGTGNYPYCFDGASGVPCDGIFGQPGYGIDCANGGYSSQCWASEGTAAPCPC